MAPYLSKASAMSWWQSWLEHAKQHCSLSEAIEMQGTIIIAGTWILNNLKVSLPVSAPSDIDMQPLQSDISGFEVSVAKPEELTCNINGIGEICTSWIGQKGVREIRREIASEEMHTQLKAKSNELKVIAESISGCRTTQQ